MTNKPMFLSKILVREDGNILENLSCAFPGLPPLYQGTRKHGECWDGGGMPKLKVGARRVKGRDRC